MLSRAPAVLVPIRTVTVRAGNSHFFSVGMDPSFLAHHWGEVKLQWHSWNHSWESLTRPGWLILWVPAIPHSIPQARPFYGWHPLKARGQAPAPQQLGELLPLQARKEAPLQHGRNCWLAEWDLSRAETAPMHTTMRSLIPAPTLFKPDLQFAFITNANSTKPLLEVSLDFGICPSPGRGLCPQPAVLCVPQAVQS